jgi:hypothetical protein
MKSPKSPHSGELEGWWEDPDDPVHILNKCASSDAGPMEGSQRQTTASRKATTIRRKQRFVRPPLSSIRFPSDVQDPQLPG